MGTGAYRIAARASVHEAPGVVRVAAAVFLFALIISGCSNGGLSDRQEDARGLIRDFVEAYVADVAPHDAGQRTDTTDASDCRTGTRLVHRVVLDAPEREHTEMMGAFERYWRETSQEEIRATADEVTISSSSDWSTRIRASDDGLELVGQTACIP